VRAQSPGAQLREPGEGLPQRPRQASDRDVRHREHASGTEHSEGLREEQGSRREVEGRLDADHAVEGAAAKGKPRCVGAHGMGSCLGEALPPRQQLGECDVHGREAAGSSDIGDQGILLREAVAHVEHVSPRWKFSGDRLDEPSHRDRSLAGVAAVAGPQPQVQPARGERDGEVLTDAVVDGGGGVRAAAEHRKRVTQVLTRPCGTWHATPRGRPRTQIARRLAA